MLTKLHREANQQTLDRPPIFQTMHDERTIHPMQLSPPVSCGRRDGISPRMAVSKGLAQSFGLDIRAAILTVLVDLLVFGGDAVSFGVLIPLGIVVAAILTFIVYRIQIKWYGDDHDSALIKAMIVGLLTAIPAPLAPVVAIPGGILGIANALRRK